MNTKKIWLTTILKCTLSNATAPKKNCLSKKILERTKKIGEKFENNINHSQLVNKIIDQLHNHIHTSEIDELLCQVCASLASTDYDYYKSSKPFVYFQSSKETNDDFIQNYTKIYNNNGGYLSTEFMEIIEKHGEYFKTFVDYENDYLIDYFGFKTLERAYLMKHDGKIHGAYPASLVACCDSNPR